MVTASFKPKSIVRRGGTLDLLLVLLVVGAAWLRTPVGGLFDHGIAWVRGTDAKLPSLVSYFVTGPPQEIVVLAEKIGVLPDLPPAPAGGFPEPWRTAARLTLDDDAALATLDTLYVTEGVSPEATLEDFAIGPELRSRAIDRARTAGEAKPESFAVHRVYLPEKAARDADRVVSGTLALATILDFRWPIHIPHRVGSPYGMRMHPILHYMKMHDGVDLSVPTGTPVYAAQSGRVRSASYDAVSGNYVVVDHGHGVRTSYCHLSEQVVHKGDMVEAGQQVGVSGSTGRSTGPHLHFTVRIGRGTVDPMRLRREPGAIPVSDDAGASDDATGG